MQENANELQYPEGTEASDLEYTNRSAVMCMYVQFCDKLNLKLCSSLYANMKYEFYVQFQSWFKVMG